MLAFIRARARPRALAVFVVLLTPPISVVATPVPETLSFATALALAAGDTPTLGARAAQLEAARQGVAPAGELPDPRLALGIANLPIDGPDRFRADRDFMTMRGVGLMQEFPNPAKRRARVAGAEGRVAVAVAEQQTTARRLRADTAVAWIARASAEAQLARLDDLAIENRHFAAAVAAQVAAGGGKASAAVEPRLEAAAIEARRDVLAARREQAIATLRRWLGDAADAPLVGAIPALPISADTLRHGLHRHPALAVFAAKDDVLAAAVDEGKAAKRPDWAVEAAYQQRAAPFSDMVSVQLSFDLPLFADTRQDPQIAARRAEQIALAAERDAAFREHRAMLAAGLAEYRRLTRALARQRELLLPLAHQKVALATAAWGGVKADLTEVMAARRERIDAELAAIALDGERTQVAAGLYFSYAEPGEDAGDGLIGGTPGGAEARNQVATANAADAAGVQP